LRRPGIICHGFSSPLKKRIPSKRKRSSHPIPRPTDGRIRAPRCRGSPFSEGRCSFRTRIAEITGPSVAYPSAPRGGRSGCRDRQAEFRGNARDS
jgi:hypothetical protein